MKRLANLLEVLSFLAIAATFLGFLGRWHFFPDLFSHLRIQAAVGLLGSGILLHLLKRRSWSVVSLVTGLVLCATLFPFLWPGRSASSPRYRLLSMNVRTSNTQKDVVAKYIVDTNPDFVVLLETDSVWLAAIDSALSTTWPYKKSVPQSDNFGIALYSKLPWTDCEVIEYEAALPTPSLAAIFDLTDGQPLRLIATHPVPPMNSQLWRSRNSVFAGLANDVASSMPKRTIVAGDFNCSPWSYWFKKLQEDSGLKASAYGQGLHISWTPIPVPLLGVPIDHVLVGSEIETCNSTVGPKIGSDHRAVVVDFN